MHPRRKHLFALLVGASIFGASWYYFFFPEEVWIRYNFVVRNSEINAIAEYVERQSEFHAFVCVEDDVWLDKQDAPKSIHNELQSHCLSAGIDMGHQTDDGSFFHLGSRTRRSHHYLIAVIHDPKLDAAPSCPRWRKLKPAEECIVRLSDDWAIHYWNATFQNEDVQGLAEDVAKSLSQGK